jgi:UDP:flavonoid glycosyltransferase YjiC (YdhE family)
MKIAIVAVGTRGDIQPHLALASTLRARGHAVSFVAPLDFESVALALGLTYSPIGISIRSLLDSEDGATLLDCGRRPLRFLTLLRKLAMPVVERLVTHVDAACADSEAVCYSLLGLPAYFSADARRVPCFSSSMQPLGRTSAFPSPLLPLNGNTPKFLNRSTHVALEQAFWHAFRPFIKRTLKRSLPVWNIYSSLYAAERPMLFAFSPLIVPRPPDWGPWMHATGYWTLPENTAWQPAPALADFLASGSPPVCVGFGSMHTPRVVERLRLALAAVRTLRRRAIVLTGWSDDLLDRSQFGDDVYATEAVPHDWLFPRVAAVIHHGGAGTTAAACRAGVPSVILPFFFDQAFWGYSMHQRSLGPAPLPRNRVSAESLGEALRLALTCDAMRAKLGALSVALRREDGAGRAADVIERTVMRH